MYVGEAAAQKWDKDRVPDVKKWGFLLSAQAKYYIGQTTYNLESGHRMKVQPLYVGCEARKTCNQMGQSGAAVAGPDRTEVF